MSLDPDRSGHVQRSLVRSAHSVPRSMDRPDEGVGAYLSMVLPCLSYYIDSSVEEQRWPRCVCLSQSHITSRHSIYRNRMYTTRWHTHTHTHRGKRRKDESILISSHPFWRGGVAPRSIFCREMWTSSNTHQASAWKLSIEIPSQLRRKLGGWLCDSQSRRLCVFNDVLFKATDSLRATQKMRNTRIHSRRNTNKKFSVWSEKEKKETPRRRRKWKRRQTQSA